MNYKPIIIIAGEPNSVFLEIFLNQLRRKLQKPFNFNIVYESIKTSYEKIKL